MSRYGSYRGRRGPSIKLLFVFVVVILLLLGVGYFVLEHYLVVSDGGVGFDFSKSTASKTPATAEPSVVPTVVVVTPEPVEVEEPAVQLPTTFVALPASALLEGTVVQTLNQEMVQGAVLTMKDIDGDTSYLYQLEVADALSDATSYLVSYLACYRDNATPYADNTLALRTNSGNWWDDQGNRWLSPDLQESNQYLVDLCVVAAKQGFQEILLDYAAFPTSAMGYTDSLLEVDRYPLDSRTAQLESFYQMVVQALEPYPEVTLSVVLAPDVLVDGGVESGQTLSVVAQYFDRIWVDSSLEEALTALQEENPDLQVVVATEESLPQNSSCQYIS